MSTAIEIKNPQQATDGSPTTGFKTVDINNNKPIGFVEDKVNTPIEKYDDTDSLAMKQSIDYETEPWTMAERTFGRTKENVGRGFKEIDYKQEALDIAAGTAEIPMTLASGMVLWPFSKVWGTLNLPFGADAAKKAEHELQSLGYSPYSKSGKEATNLVGKGFEAFLTPAKMAEEETAKYSPRAAYLVGLGGELAEFAATGGLVKGVKGKLTTKAKWEKPPTEPATLDTEFAEGIKAEKANEINIRRAKQKVQGKPLSRLKRTEEQLAIEREYNTKQTEYESVFKEIPVEKVIKAEKFKEIKVNEIIKHAEKADGIIGKVERYQTELTKKYNAKKNPQDASFPTTNRMTAVDHWVKSLKDTSEPTSTRVKYDKGVKTVYDKIDGGRTVKDTLKDFNVFMGERGEIGNATLSMRQTEAFNRLKTDVKVFKRNARKVNKSVEDYLIDMKVDPKVAALLGEKTTELKKYAGSINLEKQDVPREFKEFETEIQNPKKVQTWDKTGELSKEILSDYKKSSKVLEKGKKGDALNAEEIDAVRQMNVNAIDRLKDILKTDPKAFEAQYNTYKADIFNVLTDVSSEAGRALNIHKKNISVNRMARAFSELKRGLNKRELKEFKELNTENPLEVKQFIKRLGDPKLSDYALEYWYNSILSGPPTHIVNTVDNLLWMTYQVPHLLTKAVIDLPYSKLTGKPRTRYMNELLPMLLGYKSGFIRGRKIAGQVIRTGKIQEFETKWAQEMSSSIGAFERSSNPNVRKIGKFITPPTNALRALDAWANAMGYDAAVGQIARRLSNQKGLKGKERTAFENKVAENLTDAQHLEAVNQAKHFTFMDDPDPVTASIIKARNVPVVGPALRLTVLPFVNTISNLIKRGMEITPVVGLAKQAVSKGMGRGKSAPNIIAKQIEGAVIAAYVWDKFQKEKITGGMPESKSERDAWYRKGKMPWSIKIGDKWVSYRRVEPFNTVIASAYVAYDKALKQKDQKKIDEIFFEVANGMKNNVIDGSYFQGLQAVMNRHQKSKGAVARWSSSWVPYSSFLRSMSRAYEVATEGSAKARDGGDYQKVFSSVLPWLVDKPPAKLNVWGEEAVIPGGMLRQWLPFKWIKEKNDPVETEFEKLGFYPSVPSKKVKINGEDVEFDDAIYRKYVQTFGYRAKQKMLSIITNPNYQRVSKLGTAEKRHEARIKRELLRIRNSERRRAIREQKKLIK